MSAWLVVVFWEGCAAISFWICGFRVKNNPSRAVPARVGGEMVGGSGPPRGCGGFGRP
ncbi:hypothetical protein [Rubritalea tangerina]|uniref:hypothetical protein n=1 Tax=Rubritalea tangerina TaxID=430798 RepID=UPI0036152207